jgi:hypothetical protein
MPDLGIAVARNILPKVFNVQSSLCSGISSEIVGSTLRQSYGHRHSS